MLKGGDNDGVVAFTVGSIDGKPVGDVGTLTIGLDVDGATEGVLVGGPELEGEIGTPEVGPTDEGGMTVGAVGGDGTSGAPVVGTSVDGGTLVGRVGAGVIGPNVDGATGAMELGGGTGTPVVGPGVDGVGPGAVVTGEAPVVGPIVGGEIGELDGGVPGGLVVVPVGPGVGATTPLGGEEGGVPFGPDVGEDAGAMVFG